MGGFKRFCMVVFVICGLLALAALALPWFGPVEKEASALLGIGWYYIAVEVLLGITFVGLVVVLINAVVAPSSADDVLVSKLDGGHITVTTDAIASQAAHIVEQSTSCSVDDVDVRTKGHGHVRVFMKVVPYTSADVYDGGEALHARLVQGLKALCGDTFDSVSVQFLEPTSPDITTSPASPAPLGATSPAPLPVSPADGPAGSADVNVPLDSENE
ncbi:MAG: alkaline shock response membrane anchor protein AmaP [Atopobiaceae bacterium]|jgi:hypothetical protein|nr:alkaline shock response membrane anchor protein AmaP [Atopobiaceae bacterium]